MKAFEGDNIIVCITVELWLACIFNHTFTIKETFFNLNECLEYYTEQQKNTFVCPTVGLSIPKKVLKAEMINYDLFSMSIDNHY